MLILRARAFGLRQRDSRSGHLCLELPYVELRREALAESLTGNLQRRAAGTERTLGDRAFLVELEELQVTRHDIADERQHDGAMFSIARREIGVRGLDTSTHAPPEVELPRQVARKSRRAKRRGGKPGARDLVAT